MTASTAFSAPITPSVLDMRCINTLHPQNPVIAVDTFGAFAPDAVVMEHYGFSVDNICNRTRHLLLEAKRKS